jgi:hypothetical protein
VRFSTSPISFWSTSAAPCRATRDVVRRPEAVRAVPEHAGAEPSAGHPACGLGSLPRLARLGCSRRVSRSLGSGAAPPARTSSGQGGLRQASGLGAEACEQAADLRAPAVPAPAHRRLPDQDLPRSLQIGRRFPLYFALPFGTATRRRHTSAASATYSHGALLGTSHGSDLSTRRICKKPRPERHHSSRARVTFSVTVRTANDVGERRQNTFAT